MKVSKIKSRKHKDSLFKLVLDVGTEEEARALFAIFNHNRNTKLFRTVPYDRITDVIGYEYYADKGVISNGVEYRDFYGS